MDKIENAMQELSASERAQLDDILQTLRTDMKNVKMESTLLAHEAETAAACAFLNC